VAGFAASGAVVADDAVKSGDGPSASKQAVGPSVAKATATWVDCNSVDLTLVEPQDGLRPGTFIEIVANGKCAQAIRDTKDKEALRLQLSGIVMPGLPVTKRVGKCAGLTVEGAGKSLGCDATSSNQLVLTFLLKRDTAETDNRRAWGAFVEKVGNRGHVGSIALALGDGSAIEVSSLSDVQFRVGLGDRGPTILAVVALLFVLAFRYLAKRGGLSDRRLSIAARPPGTPVNQLGPTYSLARVQMAFWGLVVALSFLGIYWTTGTMEVINQQVLVLLGISAATGLGSVLVGDTKQVIADQTRVAEPVTQTNTPGDKSKFLSDILSDGDGNVSVHRFQSLLWTIVLGSVFVYTVISTLTMPEFSVTLLTLMGISNGTYLGFKYSDKA